MKISIQKKWDQTKKGVKDEWNRITNKSAEAIKNNLHKLSKALHSAYEATKQKADNELETIASSIHHATTPKTQKVIKIGPLIKVSRAKVAKQKKTR